MAHSITKAIGAEDTPVECLAKVGTQAMEVVVARPVAGTPAAVAATAAGAKADHRRSPRPGQRRISLELGHHGCPDAEEAGRAAKAMEGRLAVGSQVISAGTTQVARVGTGRTVLTAQVAVAMVGTAQAAATATAGIALVTAVGIIEEVSPAVKPLLHRNFPKAAIRSTFANINLYGRF